MEKIIRSSEMPVNFGVACGDKYNYFFSSFLNETEQLGGVNELKKMLFNDLSFFKHFNCS